MKVKEAVALTEKNGEKRLDLLKRLLSPKDRFVYYIHERFEIRQRRARGLRRSEWTHDPILETYKFTNVRREWDYTTQWLLDHWYIPYGDRITAGLAAALARFICFVPSLEAIGFPKIVQWERWEKVLLRRQADGEKIFTSAYMIRADKPGIPKIVTVCTNYLAPVWNEGKRSPLNSQWRSALDLHHALSQYHGWGDFMTQEVVLDLMYTWVASGTRDKRTYAWAGPGALRGLNRIAEQALDARFNRLDAREAMIDLREELVPRLPLALRESFTVHDVEFCLCEFDKYERALWDQGRPKQLFTPRELPV